jgi:hypothetical protein
MSNATINTFEAGLDLDSNEVKILEKKLRDCWDLVVTKNNNFFSLEPINGTKKEKTLFDGTNFTDVSTIDSDAFSYINILGAVESFISVLGANKYGSVVFVARKKDTTNSLVSLFEIYFFYEENSIVQDPVLAYREEIEDDNIFSSFIDGFRSTEGNIDVVYFKGYDKKLGKIRCVKEEATFTKEQIGLLRTESLNPPSFVSLDEGGSLACGVYFFSYRLIDEATGRKTRVSLISEGIAISNVTTNDEGRELISGSLGSFSTKKIKLNLSFPETQSDYSHFQVYVIKEVVGIPTYETVAYVLEPTTKGNVLSVDFEYTGNGIETTVPIEELTVDDAYIYGAESIAVKNNFLIAGNIKYKELEYDRGNVTIANSTTPFKYKHSTATISAPFINYFNPTLDTYSRFGYFRDEVYRFYISYHDELGYWSSPQHLDFSSVTLNRADTGCVDFKFPSRIESDWTLANEVGELENLGLEIKQITNHPTWAKGFVILRAKRLKDIQFQTPVIHTAYVQPLLASASKDKSSVSGSDGYPDEGYPEFESATPPNPKGTFVPKTLRKVLPMHIIRDDQDCKYHYGYDEEIDAINSLSKVQEIKSSAASTAFIHCIFPPNNLYNFNGERFEPYFHTPSDKLDVIDAACLSRASGRLDKEIVFDQLDYKDYVGYASYNASPESYYYKRGQSKVDLRTVEFNILSGQKIIPENLTIKEYGELNNYDEKYVIKTTLPTSTDVLTFGDHKSMITNGLPDNTPPDNLRMSIIITNKELIDPAYSSGKNLSILQSNIFDDVIDWDTQQKIDPLLLCKRDELNNAASLSLNGNDPASETKLPIYIANVKRGLSDFRYGSKNDFHELIYCNYRKLTEDEVTNNTSIDISITGGDCSIDLHSFKVANKTYSLSMYEGTSISYTLNRELNPVTNDNVIRKWGSSFRRESSATFSNNVNGKTNERGRPVSVKANSEIVSVFLESEIPASFVERLTNTKLEVSSAALLPYNAILDAVPSSVSDALTPFDYIYNLSYAKKNEYKLWFPKNEFNEEKSNFPTRIVYSDQRIYQTTEKGFDRFRAANFYDIDESYGFISKLKLFKDNLLCFTENSLMNIPVLGQVIETADGSSLSIRNAEVIGIPRFISSINGTKYPKTIIDSGNSLFFVDSNTSSVFMLKEGLQEISSLGVKSFFDEKLNKYNYSNPRLVSYYDYVNKNYVVTSLGDTANDRWMMLWSDLTNTWQTKIGTDSSFCVGDFLYIQKKLYGLGKFNGLDVSLYSFNNYNEGFDFLGRTIDPSAKFIINKDNLFSKTFDVFNINASGKLKDINIATNYNISSAGMNIDNSSLRENTYRIPIIYDSEGKRIRGTFAEVDINWEANSNVKLNSVLTKYRLSSRII